MPEPRVDQVNHAITRPISKEGMARQWAEELKHKDMTPQQVVGVLFFNECKTVSYDTESRNWNPVVGGGERRMIYTSGIAQRGPHFGAEVMKIGLGFSFKIEGSEYFKNEGMWFIPYPSFDDDGKFNPKDSKIILLNDKQKEDLEALVETL